MSLYDEVSVAEGTVVNIPPPKTLYQTNSLDSKMRDLSIDKDGVIRYNAEPSRLITILNLELYGEDETGYNRKYVMAVVMNHIQAVREVQDDGTFIDTYTGPYIKSAAKRMADNMIPLHGRKTR